jgi:hypothetical protein
VIVARGISSDILTCFKNSPTVVSTFGLLPCSDSLSTPQDIAETLAETDYDDSDKVVESSVEQGWATTIFEAVKVSFRVGGNYVGLEVGGRRV